MWDKQCKSETSKLIKSIRCKILGLFQKLAIFSREIDLVSRNLNSEIAILWCWIQVYQKSDISVYQRWKLNCEHERKWLWNPILKNCKSVFEFKKNPLMIELRILSFNQLILSSLAFLWAWRGLYYITW